VIFAALVPLLLARERAGSWAVVRAIATRFTAIAIMVSTLATHAMAETIAVRSAVVRATEDAYVMDAEFDLALTAPLEAALLRGTPLYFVLDTEMTRLRPYWFDDSVSTPRSVRRLTYIPLTSTYRVDTGIAVSTSANYTSLEEALRQIRLIRGRTLIDKNELRKGERYEVSLRLRLDTTQLPKPLQVNTLVSREWTLSSDWYRVVVTP
jgi:Domain of unknown function (DUF4390)